MTPYIGMPVWFFDVNRRVYDKNSDALMFGRPIWREHWVKKEIVGETARSWLVDTCGGRHDLKWAVKYPKKGWPHNLALSEHEIDEAAFVEDNRVRVADMVRSNLSAEKLRQIIKILEAK